MEVRQEPWVRVVLVRGMLRVSPFKDITVLSGSGVGGGSLVYSMVLLRHRSKLQCGQDRSDSGIKHACQSESHFTFCRILHSHIL